MRSNSTTEPDDKGAHPLDNWWRHRAPRIMIIADVAAAISVPLSTPHWFGFVPSVVALAGVLGGFAHHRLLWCERCVVDAAPRPEREQLASRRGWALRLAHRPTSQLIVA